MPPATGRGSPRSDPRPPPSNSRPEPPGERRRSRSRNTCRRRSPLWRASRLHRAFAEQFVDRSGVRVKTRPVARAARQPHPTARHDVSRGYQCNEAHDPENPPAVPSFHFLSRDEKLQPDLSPQDYCHHWSTSNLSCAPTNAGRLRSARSSPITLPIRSRRKRRACRFRGRGRSSSCARHVASIRLATPARWGCGGARIPPDCQVSESSRMPCESFRSLPERACAKLEPHPIGLLPVMRLICFSRSLLTSWVLKSATSAEEPGPIHRPPEPYPAPRPEVSTLRVGMLPPLTTTAMTSLEIEILTLNHSPDWLYGRSNCAS